MSNIDKDNKETVKDPSGYLGSFQYKTRKGTIHKRYDIYFDDKSQEIVLLDITSECEKATHLHFNDINDFVDFIDSINKFGEDLRKLVQ